MKNYLAQTFWLTALVAGILLLVSALSERGDFQFRKVDILQDVRTKEEASDSTGSAFLKNENTTPSDSFSTNYDTSRIGFSNPEIDTLTGLRIEDYTREQRRLDRFFAAVDSIRTAGRAVRVAFFGDSFVEGDILLGDLRDTLQTLWGGGGVGYVPATSEVARFRRSFQQIFAGFKTFGIVKNSDARLPFGINGFVYLPENEAKMHFEGIEYFRNSRRWEQVRLFFSAEKNVQFVWQNESEPPKMETLKASSGRVETWKWTATAGATPAFAMRFPEAEGLKIYGASLENRSGLSIDNFSMRGLTGGKLKHIAVETARQFDFFQKYDLVVVQLGLNAVTNSLKNIPWYEKELDEAFAHLRACFPAKPILIVSVADRGGKVEGELRTMYAVPAIAKMQRELSKKHGFLFWDLFHAMGGEGSMVRLAHQKPALANKDYTHLTHEGGRVMGHLVADMLLREQADFRAARLASKRQK